MFATPQSPDVTQELDDDYLQSNPFQYFCSRIDGLLSSSHSDASESQTELRRAFLARLGAKEADSLFPYDAGDRNLQIATDAFALRHHAAESLVRLYHAITVGRSQESHSSLWATIADGPARTVQLVDESRKHFSSKEGVETFWLLVLPETVSTMSDHQDEANAALNNMASWLSHAMSLLVRDDININAGHNKVKHGLTVRSRGDLKLTLTTTAPDEDGNVPLSALTGPSAVDILDSVSLDFLARPPKRAGRIHGLEVTTLKLVPEQLLAETWLMAVTHAAMFHVTAARHFAGRKVEFARLPPLPLGPSPEELLGDSVVGIRRPVTTPPDGGALTRKQGIAFQRSFVPLDVQGAGLQARIVEG